MKKAKGFSEGGKFNRFQQKKQAKRHFEDEHEEIKNNQSSEEEEENVQSSSLINSKRVGIKKQHAAWEDDDDKGVLIDISSVARLKKLKKNKEETVITGQEYQERLQNFYNEKLNHVDFFNWGTNIDGSSAADAGTEDPLESKSFLKDLISGAASLFEAEKGGGLMAKKKARTGTSLPEGTVRIERSGICAKGNKHEAVVQCVDVHKNNEILLSAAYDKYLKIFSTRQSSRDSFKKELKLLKNVFLDNMPILHSEFIETKNEILSCGLKRHLISYDLVNDKFDKISSSMFTSRYQKLINKFAVSPLQNYIALYNEQGFVTVLSGSTKQFLYEFKMNEECNSVCFDSESKYLFSAGVGGKIYQWDLQKRSIFNCFNDVGSTNTTCLGVSENGNYLASGNSSGTVNIYEIAGGTVNSKSPIKEIQNLTTNITDVKWNKEGEILGIYSKWKRNAVRLAHFPSMTVFSNWPNMKTNLKFITALEFSDDCKHMVMGNDEGRVYMYDFPYY